MDTDVGTGVPADAGAASEPPLGFTVALWIPVAAVMTWFLVRLFAGRWITDPDPWRDRPDDDDAPRLS